MESAHRRAHSKECRHKKKVPEAEAVEVVCRLTNYHESDSCLRAVTDTILKCIPPDGYTKRGGNICEEKSYEFSHVFHETDGQKYIFERCGKDLIKGLLTGYNGLLFTYGVTGSGKTYTMTGRPTPGGSGILPRTLDVIFNSIVNKLPKCIFFSNGKNGFGIRSGIEAHMARKQSEIERQDTSQEVDERYTEESVVAGYVEDYVCSVFVSYIEIFNNYCYDLLEKNNSQTKKETRLDSKGVVYVEGISELEVENSNEALEIFCRGEEKRRTAETSLNRDSSRSHSVFTIKLVMAPISETSNTPYPASDLDQIVVSQLCLVDLAGSERAKRTNNVGERLMEAGNINKSLMVLRQCIDKLRRNQRGGLMETVPYRDSKLTYLFKNYFEGSGKVRMIICANPRPSDFEENLNVLAFAEESQNVKVQRGEDRLEMTTNGFHIPRPFYLSRRAALEQIMNPFTNNEFVLESPPVSTIKSPEDAHVVRNLIEYYEKSLDDTKNLVEYLKVLLSECKQNFMNAIIQSNYSKIQLEALREEKEQSDNHVLQLSSELKQVKRALASLTDRVQKYETDEKNLANIDNYFRGVRETREYSRKQERVINAAIDICENSVSPSVTRLRNKFDVENNTPIMTSSKRKMISSSSTQLAERAERKKMGATPGGPGYMDPKCRRRSKSASRTLDHQPLNVVPIGGILRPVYPSNAKHVTKPEMSDLLKSSEYVLTHQEVDNEGNVSTSIVKGDCIPTAGGGTAVLFNDVERVTHTKPPRSRSSRR
ncbi:unnamed protein product [Auanema sp. JU1783]|nr:unnamed protein product [Auanema sp. JU1783]